MGPGVNPSVRLLGEMLLFTLRAHLLVNTCLHFCWVHPWSGIAGSLGLLCFCFLFCQILDPAKQLLERVAWICIPCPVGVLGVLFPPILGTVSFVSAISMHVWWYLIVVYKDFLERHLLSPSLLNHIPTCRDNLCACFSFFKCIYYSLLPTVTCQPWKDQIIWNPWFYIHSQFEMTLPKESESLLEQNIFRCTSYLTAKYFKDSAIL